MVELSRAEALGAGLQLADRDRHPPRQQRAGDGGQQEPEAEQRPGLGERGIDRRHRLRER